MFFCYTSYLALFMIYCLCSLYVCALCVLLRCFRYFFFLMIRRPPRSTLDRSSAASDVYKRQDHDYLLEGGVFTKDLIETWIEWKRKNEVDPIRFLSLIHISEPTRPY